VFNKIQELGNFAMPKSFLSIVIPAFVASTSLTTIVVSPKAHLVPAPAADTLATFEQKNIGTDTASEQTSLQPLDSLAAAKPKNFIPQIKEWANNNEGLLTFIFGLSAASWALFLYWRSRRTRRKPEDAMDKRDAKQRYLEHVTTAHQHLPVAGFETNLRVPIPLEKVYVTLHARMAELEHVRAEGGVELAELRETPPDRTVIVQVALKFALSRKYDGVVILGHPGSGKTTLIKYFLLCFATNKAEKNLGLSQKLLPILLLLREVEPQKSLAENILSPLQKYQLSLDEHFFLSDLHNGQAILLLDGLDEVPTEEKRQQVSRCIHKEVHLAFPRCPVIVTSRFSGYRGNAVLPGHYLRLEIQDYQLEQVGQFIENWLTAVETHLNEDNKYWRNQARIAADDLYRRIGHTPTLRDLAVNPLMLQIIALVHRDRNTLPERRVELYKECTDVLLERWDKAKGLDVLLSAAEARRLLQPVALWMHSVENRREVSKQEILDFIAPVVPQIKHEVNPEELLKSWQERSGIFKGEGESYFFHHLSFQEYLTAEEIRNTRQVEILVKNFDKAWWREPTLLAMGLTNPPIFADFMRALLRANRRDGAGMDLMLRCIDETLRKDEAPFVEALQRLRRFEARYQALLGLERIGTEAAESAVKETLQDRDPRLANFARTILAKWGEMPIVERAETISVLVKGEARKLPARLFNAIELNAEYILIPGAKGKTVFEGTGKLAPDYPLYVAKYPVTNKLYRRFIEYLSGKGKEEALTRFPKDQFAQSLLAKAEKIEGFVEYLGKDVAQWVEKFSYYNDKRFNGDDQPVAGVTWFAATAYCHWLTELRKNDHKSKSQTERGAVGTNQTYLFRLPTEEEREWAASGGKRKYPCALFVAARGSTSMMICGAPLATTATRVSYGTTTASAWCAPSPVFDTLFLCSSDTLKYCFSKRRTRLSGFASKIF
jgi:hypothetical protein